MTETCEECGKLGYRSAAAAAAVARRRSAAHAVALRTYPCPHHATWHLTSTPARPTTTRAGADARPDYRRRMAATLAERVVVRRRDLIDVGNAGADPQYSIAAAHGLIDAWCEHGLAELYGSTVVAADPTALHEVVALGWSAWLQSAKRRPATLDDTRRTVDIANARHAHHAS
jgi:hypothetical protein